MCSLIFGAVLCFAEAIGLSSLLPFGPSAGDANVTNVDDYTLTLPLNGHLLRFFPGNYPGTVYVSARLKEAPHAQLPTETTKTISLTHKSKHVHTSVQQQWQ